MHLWSSKNQICAVKSILCQNSKGMIFSCKCSVKRSEEGKEKSILEKALKIRFKYPGKRRDVYTLQRCTCDVDRPADAFAVVRRHIND